MDAPGRASGGTFPEVPSATQGRLAQLVERLPYKQEVACSSQAPPMMIVRARVPEVHEFVAHPMEPQFADLRRERRQHYAQRSPDRSKRRAVVTITHNETLFFPIWLRYYSAFFDPSDIYVSRP